MANVCGDAWCVALAHERTIDRSCDPTIRSTLKNAKNERTKTASDALRVCRERTRTKRARV